MLKCTKFKANLSLVERWMVSVRYANSHLAVERIGNNKSKYCMSTLPCCLYAAEAKNKHFLLKCLSTVPWNVPLSLAMPISPATIPQQYVNTSKQTHTNQPTWSLPIEQHLKLLSCGISSDEAVAPSFKSRSQQQSSSEYQPGKRNLIRKLGGKFCVSHCVTETAFYQEHTQGIMKVVHNNVADIAIILLSGFLTLRHCHQQDKMQIAQHSHMHHDPHYNFFIY